MQNVSVFFKHDNMNNHHYLEGLNSNSIFNIKITAKPNKLEATMHEQKKHFVNHLLNFSTLSIRDPIRGGRTIIGLISRIPVYSSIS